MQKNQESTKFTVPGGYSVRDRELVAWRNCCGDSPTLTLNDTTIGDPIINEMANPGLPGAGALDQAALDAWNDLVSAPTDRYPLEFVFDASSIDENQIVYLNLNAALHPPADTLDTTVYAYDQVIEVQIIDCFQFLAKPESTIFEFSYTKAKQGETLENPVESLDTMQSVGPTREQTKICGSFIFDVESVNGDLKQYTGSNIMIEGKILDFYFCGIF